MPINLKGLGGGLLAGGASLLGTGISAIARSGQNKKSRQFTEKMYERQKQDNLDFWNMQNSYNSPEQQMERLRSAKLNPNLVYGNGNAIQPAQLQKAPTAQTPRFEAPNFEGIGTAATTAINTMYDTQLKKAQTDKLQASRDVDIQEAVKKAAEIQNIGITTNQEKIRLRNLKLYSSDAQKASLDNVIANTKSTTESNQRANQLQPLHVKEKTLDLVRKETSNRYTEAQIKLAMENVKLKKIENKLAIDGLSLNDSALMKIIVLNKEIIIKELMRLFGTTQKNSLWQRSN